VLWEKIAKTQKVDSGANAVNCHFVWVQVHSTWKSGESCISCKDRNWVFVLSLGKKVLWVTMTLSLVVK